MTDRLEDLLAAGPPGDTDVTGLAGLVRSRRSARRRTTAVVVGTVVAVAAVPVAFALTGPAPETSPAPCSRRAAVWSVSAHSTACIAVIATCSTTSAAAPPS